jgi:uncharacterized membrane protein (UPF0136 family)
MVLRCYGFEAVTMVNLALCTLILLVGCLGYGKTKSKVPFHIGVAFGLFAVSHTISLFGVQASFVVTNILLRVFAYLIVLFSLWEIYTKK